MTDEQRKRGSVGDEVREGIRAGLGILGALKDAVEETVQDMMNRGELSPDRAREAVRTTMERAQTAFDDARMRLDFVPRRDFDALKAEVQALRLRIETIERGGGGAAGGAGAGDIPVTES